MYLGTMADTHYEVSIHASRCREAMPFEQIEYFPSIKFQSTPPVAGRRCHVKAIEAVAISQFQSTPPVAGRRCNDQSNHHNADACFNPRLLLPGGDAHRVLPESSLRIVSIHASRCREAMRPVVQ